MELVCAKRPQSGCDADLYDQGDDVLELSDEEVLAYPPSWSGDEESEDIESPGGSNNAKQRGTVMSVDGREHKRSGNEHRMYDDEGSEQEDGDEALENWGSSKQDYYNADAIETEQDALEEEAEALRLQQKHLKNMSEADYGFDEAEWSTQEPTGTADDHSKGQTVVTETLPQLQISEDMSFPERLKVLRSRYPELEPLSKDLLSLQERYQLVSEELNRLHENTKSSQNGSPGLSDRLVGTKANILQVQQQALSLYLATVSLYFAFLTSNASEDGDLISLPLSAMELRNHEIMEELIHSRALWLKVKDMEVPERKDGLDTTPQHKLSTQVNGHKDSDDRTNALDVPDVTDIQETRKRSKDQKKASRNSAKQFSVQAAAAARHEERMRRMEEDLATLNDLTSTGRDMKSAKTSSSEKRIPLDEASDLGEENQFTAEDLANKAKKKRSLRFYTSQIAQKSNKRGAAGRDAGGDMDIPYRERLKDRQARLNAEAEKRGKRQDEAAALGGESDEEDHRQAREVREDAGGGEDYYDLIAARSKQRKQHKRDRAQAYAQATKEGGRVVETPGEIGADGKRAISYAIEKNRSLAPKRRKEAKNPRVKKRQKFEQKKKKLGSMKPVYKGGEGKGGYQGELTGIKKGVVRSVKL